MEKAVLALIGVVLFAKILPLILTALILVGGTMIIAAVIKEGKQL